MPDTNQNGSTSEDIQQRAYQNYVDRGFRSGEELADWLAAEGELAKTLSPQEPPAVTSSSEFSSTQLQGIPSTSMLDFYGLREQPFGMTPDPAFLYAGRTHGEALDALSHGIADNRGFLALIAEPGMGKTTLLYQLMDQLRDTSRTVLIFQTQCTSRELIEYILQDQGVDVRGLSHVTMHGKLNEILFEELLNGKRFILIVDEAQNLDESVLETVRMLSNFETHNTKLLQIILSGQPQLAEKLAQPRLAQLRQRIAVLARLEPFTVEETGRYIEHRLRIGGYSGESLFDRDSIQEIARCSRGIPRNINNLCYQSLMTSFTGGARTVTAQTVQKAAARLEMGAAFLRPPDVAEPHPEPATEPEPTTLASTPLEQSPDADASPVAAAPSAASIAVAASASAPGPRHVPVTVATHPDARMNAHLTYDAGKKVNSPKWPVRSAIVAILVLSGTLLVGLLARTQSRRVVPSASVQNSTPAADPAIPADRSDSATANYDAAPLDTGNGQVLTVAAGPQQSVKDLCLRYVGHFDSALFDKIRGLNPDLKDPDHLEEGQLIRLPLPPGAMRKTNDTGDATAASAPEESQSLFSRLTALLHVRR